MSAYAAILSKSLIVFSHCNALTVKTKTHGGRTKLVCTENVLYGAVKLLILLNLDTCLYVFNILCKK